MLDAFRDSVRLHNQLNREPATRLFVDREQAPLATATNTLAYRVSSDGARRIRRFRLVVAPRAEHHQPFELHGTIAGTDAHASLVLEGRSHAVKALATAESDAASSLPAITLASLVAGVTAGAGAGVGVTLVVVVALALAAWAGLRARGVDYTATPDDDGYDPRDAAGDIISRAITQLKRPTAAPSELPWQLHHGAALLQRIEEENAGVEPNPRTVATRTVRRRLTAAAATPEYSNSH